MEADLTNVTSNHQGIDSEYENGKLDNIFKSLKADDPYYLKNINKKVCWNYRNCKWS